MRCPRCQHDNRPGARFCEECATALQRACAACGAPLSATAKFCPECAHPTAAPPARQFVSPQVYTPKHLAERILTSKAAIEGERKHVTILFADLKGSLELLADRDPEEARKLLDPVLERMIDANDAPRRADGAAGSTRLDAVDARHRPRGRGLRGGQASRRDADPGAAGAGAGFRAHRCRDRAHAAAGVGRARGHGLG